MSEQDKFARLQLLDILMEFKVKIMGINTKRLKVTNDYAERYGLATTPALLEENVTNLVAFLKGEL